MKQKQVLKSEKSCAGRLSCAVAAGLGWVGLAGAATLPWVDVSLDMTPSCAATSEGSLSLDARWQSIAEGGPIDMATTPRGAVFIIR